MAFSFRNIRFFRYILPLILALIFFSFTGQSYRRAQWYEDALWNLVVPVQSIFQWAGHGISGVWRRYFWLVTVERENENLGRKVAELETEIISLKEIEKENERLRELLQYEKEFPEKTLVARVIANDMRAEFRSITINKGSKEGVLPLVPVLGHKGLVGKVGKVGRYEALVILITDPNSAVDALVQRSRARGMVVGGSWNASFKSGNYLTRFEYLKGASNIEDGDIVVTSGLDRVFPPGIAIGTVSDLKLSPYGVFTQGNVIPFENMAELQEVIVLLRRAEASR